MSAAWRNGLCLVLTVLLLTVSMPCEGGGGSVASRDLACLSVIEPSALVVCWTALPVGLGMAAGLGTTPGTSIGGLFPPPPNMTTLDVPKKA
jgi:hypothetical protein